MTFGGVGRIGEGFTVGSIGIRQAWVRKATQEREKAA